MSPRHRSEEAPVGFRVVLAMGDPELTPPVAAVLLRMVKRHAERTTAPPERELSVDGRTDHQWKESPGDAR